MIFDLGPTRKRTLGKRDREKLFIRAKKKCEACNKKLCFTEIQVGHKKAHSKGGSATLRNTVCLCYRCNKLQGTQSFESFLKQTYPEKYGKLKEKKEASKPKKVKRKVGETIFGEPIYKMVTVTVSKKKPTKKKTTKKKTTRKKKEDSIFDWF
ncbi:HNH endonuclease [Candidatus Woesearchaeota archaeon]|nr:HNH endonuclease [Candidatus Woesearchaeota archaeon]